MRRTFLRLGLLCSVAAAAGCGTGAGGEFPSSGAPRQARNFISTEEIRANNAQNAYDAVRSMRSQWLNTNRTEASSITQLVVYYDNARMGGAESLRQISMGPVTSMRYFDAAAATYRWGAGHGAGAILVSTGSNQ